MKHIYKYLLTYLLLSNAVEMYTFFLLIRFGRFAHVLQYICVHMYLVERGLTSIDETNQSDFIKLFIKSNIFHLFIYWMVTSYCNDRRTHQQMKETRINKKKLNEKKSNEMQSIYMCSPEAVVTFQLF